MIQKVIKVGNSWAVTIPRKFIDAQGISEESTVSLDLQPRTGKVILDFLQKEQVGEVIDTEVYQVAKDLLHRYLPAFKELAKK